MRPLGRAEALLGAALLCALGGLWSAEWTVVAWSIIAVVLLGAAIEALNWRRRPAFTIRREIAGSVAIGHQVKVTLFIDNPKGALRVKLFDHVPSAFEFEGMPRTVDLAPESTTTLHYFVTGTRRGTAVFHYVELHLRGVLGFFVKRKMVPAGSVVRILPDFQAVRGYELLSVLGKQSAIGIRRRQRRGEGLDFHQLRDWREGDSLRQVDWKATSRRGKVTSKEYQEERDQRVVFLLDKSRRMRATSNDVSHFDSTLNAILLLTSVAVRQGDAVGLLSFGGETTWSPMRKGPGAQTAILKHVVELEPSLAPADFAQAAAELVARVPKRSLVVLATNLRGEDAEEIRPALALLRKRHLVLLANLREEAVESLASRVPADLAEAQTTAMALIDRAERRQLLSRLTGRGVVGMDVEPEELGVELVNRYLDVKAAGRL